MIKKEYYINSAGRKLYVQLSSTDKISAPAVIIGHGLRSSYAGFLDKLSKRLRQVGYIVVKFHFVGTGKSDGLFEHKTNTTMLKNLEDVIDFVSKQPAVKNLAYIGRSNAGSLAVIHGSDQRIKAYAFLASAVFFSKNMLKFIKDAKLAGQYLVHPSFQRPHTKGKGRLPSNYIEDTKKYDQRLLKNVPKLKRVLYIQSTKDEVVWLSEGHYDYWKKHLSWPRKIILVEGGNHSFKGKKQFVIDEVIKWFCIHLPVRK